MFGFVFYCFFVDFCARPSSCLGRPPQYLTFLHHGPSVVNLYGNVYPCMSGVCTDPMLPPPTPSCRWISAHTSAADFHLAQLSRLLLPTLTTRVCMHAVLQAGGSDAGAKTERGAVTPGPPSATSTEGPSENAQGGFVSEFPASSSGDSPRGDSLPVSVPVDVGEGARQEAAAAGLGGAASPAVDMWTSLVALLEVCSWLQSARRVVGWWVLRQPVKVPGLVLMGASFRRSWRAACTRLLCRFVDFSIRFLRFAGLLQSKTHQRV